MAHQLWRHPDDALATADQEALQGAGDVAAVLEGEPPLLALFAGPEQKLLVSRRAGRNGELGTQLAARLIDGHGGVGALVGVDSDYDHWVPFRL